MKKPIQLELLPTQNPIPLHPLEATTLAVETLFNSEKIPYSKVTKEETENQKHTVSITFETKLNNNRNWVFYNFKIRKIR